MTGTEYFVYLQIAESVRRQILSGELRPGERLPAVRTMAERWHCTPTTVSRAYGLLAREGLVSGHRGSGTRVVSPDLREHTGERSSEWQWASLVNRAEAYLLEAFALGHGAAHAEAALAAAIARLEEMRCHTVAASPAPPDAGQLRFSGSHDLSVELLARSLSKQDPPVGVVTEFVGSLGGLMALTRGEADLAGVHLWDEITRTYNVPFVQRVLPNRKVVLFNLVHRIQGLIVPPGNPAGLTRISDLNRPGVILVNRQPGSGTRVWLDVQLKRAGISPEEIAGYDHEECTHTGVARAVAEGRATVGVGIFAAAMAYGLGFVPLGKERYDLVIPLAHWDLPSIRCLRSVVCSKAFQQAVLALGGYDVSETGSEIRLC